MTDRVAALRVFRVAPGQTVYARTLSPMYGGLLTHWMRNRSYYCAGENCNPVVHKAPTVWKGYAAVQLWDESAKKWQPVVFEISESLELDVRGIWARGQVWEFFRLPQTGRKATPIEGKLMEELDPEDFSDPFDIMPPIKCIYHYHFIDLKVKNPLPARVYVEGVNAPPPSILQAKEETRLPDDFSFAEAAKKHNSQKKTPTEKKFA